MDCFVASLLAMTNSKRSPDERSDIRVCQLPRPRMSLRSCGATRRKTLVSRSKILNLSELFDRAYWGKVGDAELSEVVRMITSGETEDLYILIQILGRAGSPRYRKIVEPYLHDVGDPQLSALAVQVLCWSWGLAREYRSELVCF